MNKKQIIIPKIHMQVPSDFICEHCSGFGVINMKPTIEIKAIPGKDYRTEKCKCCDGKGYFDWIKQVLR